MKKFFLLLSLLLASTLTAQIHFNTGASFNIGIPTGSFSDLVETGIGGSIIGELVFSDKLSATISGSYQNFPGKGEGFAVQGKVIDFSIQAIPVLAGVRYYFVNDIFGFAETGVHFLRVTADIYDVYSEEKVSTDYEAKYAGGIGIGYRYQLAAPSVFELSGAYQIVQDDFNSFTIRLGVLILLDNI